MKHGFSVAQASISTEPLSPEPIAERVSHGAADPQPDALRLLPDHAAELPSVVEVAPQTDALRLLPELELGDDPFDFAEATAAIAGEMGGEDGGSSFVRLQRIDESASLMPLDLSYARAGAGALGEPDLQRLSGVARADDTDVLSALIAPPATIAPPVVPAKLSVLEDHTLSGNILTGKTGGNGNPLNITHFVVNGQTYTAGTTASITDASRVAKWQNVGTLKIDANGEYTFIPSADWNGAVPNVTYLISDGSNASADVLEIDVIPVNDQPWSLHMMTGSSAAAGESYAIVPQLFPVRDDKDQDVDGLRLLPTKVIIESLPPLGGTLLYKGAPAVVGQEVTLAELQAGELVYKVDADYRGGELLPFSFRVVDGGGTENGGVETSDLHLFRMSVSKIVTGNNFSERIIGGSGKDILIGDAGGTTNLQVDANADLNIALVLDKNAFTNLKFKGSQITKEEAIKQALDDLLNNQLLSHTGKVNVALITFNGSVSVTELSVTDLNTGNIQSILNSINSLTGYENMGANYTQAFEHARAWFDQMATQGYGNYQNQSFFLTNSEYNGQILDQQAAAFELLKQLSAVHAIDVNHHNNGKKWGDTDRGIINQYDTTGPQHQVADPFRYSTHADFQNTNGANNLNAWEVSGTAGGVVSIVTDNAGDSKLSISLGSIATSREDRSTVATQAEAEKMVVTDPEGAYFSFSIPLGGTNFYDTFVWRLLKWDASANGGQGDWIVAEKGGDTLGNFAWNNEVITTSHQTAGEYRFQFEVAGTGLIDRESRVEIDNIRIHKPALEGTPQFVHDPDELGAALSIQGVIQNSVGHDYIRTSQIGLGIVFGDALNVDGLPWGVGTNPQQPTDKHGMDALKYFLQETLGHAPTHNEIFDYIWDNHRLFNVASDTHGGDDLIQGGEHNNLIYGGGGNDSLFAGIGGNNIVYGGAGNDYISVGSTGNNTLVGGSGNDTFNVQDSRVGNNTFVWLDGDAGTVALPAKDTIHGFSTDKSSRPWQWSDNGKGSGHDILDLRDLLIGEDDAGADLTQYLNFTYDGQHTSVKISSTGDLQNGFDQQIDLRYIDLTGGLTDQLQIIQTLLNNGTLLIDT